MRYCSRRRAGFAQPLLVALFPIALVAPAAEAQRVPVTGYHSTGDVSSAASPWRNPGGGDAGNSAGPPWHRRLPPYEGRRGAPGFGGGANWLPGAAGALGLLPAWGAETLGRPGNKCRSGPKAARARLTIGPIRGRHRRPTRPASLISPAQPGSPARSLGCPPKPTERPPLAMPALQPGRRREPDTLPGRSRA